MHMYQIDIFYRGLNPNFQAAECSRCSWVMTMIVISINWEIVATMFFFHGTAIPVVRLFLGNPWPILDGAWAQSKSNESLHELFVFHVEARALRISCLDQVEPGSDVGGSRPILGETHGNLKINFSRKSSNMCETPGLQGKYGKSNRCNGRRNL